jgi:disulfide bond formation protein DsbB
MKFELTRRKVFAGLALIIVALLSMGLILEHLLSQAPCPLCILDRMAFMLFALIALSGAIHDPPPRVAARYAGAMALAALAGLGIASWHLWTLHHPKFGCGIDVMEEFVNSLPTAKLLPFLFHASGDCSERNDPLLGLVAPEWALCWFAVLFLAAAVLAYKWRSAAPARAGS